MPTNRASERSFSGPSPRMAAPANSSAATGSTESLLNVATLLGEAQRNNARDGLTGVLAAHDGWFLQVIEGQRSRVQVFEGIVIKRQGSGARETFTVRKQSFGVGVERTFPMHSPKIERIEVMAIGDVNRAKLYYLRSKVGKKARVREKQRS